MTRFSLSWTTVNKIFAGRARRDLLEGVPCSSSGRFSSECVEDHVVVIVASSMQFVVSFS